LPGKNAKVVPVGLTATTWAISDSLDEKVPNVPVTASGRCATTARVSVFAGSSVATDCFAATVALALDSLGLEYVKPVNGSTPRPYSLNAGQGATSLRLGAEDLDVSSWQRAGLRILAHSWAVPVIHTV